MSRPSPDGQPTTVMPQQTTEQPSVSTAPATRRSGLWQHVPARIGKARTSTVVIGCLFILLFALNAALPQPGSATVPVTTSDGRTIQVPRSYVPGNPATTPPPTSPATPGTSEAPTPPPTSTNRAPRTSDGSGTTAPTPRTPSTSSAPTTSRAPATSRAPSPTPEPTTAPTTEPSSPTDQQGESTSAPTS